MGKPFKVALTFIDYFPFVKTDRPDPSSRNKNFTFNQNYPARSVKSWMVCTKKIVFFFSAKTLRKSRFHFQTDWSGSGPAGQFWQMESALRSVDEFLDDSERLGRQKIKRLLAVDEILYYNKVTESG